MFAKLDPGTQAARAAGDVTIDRVGTPAETRSIQVLSRPLLDPVWIRRSIPGGERRSENPGIADEVAPRVVLVDMPQLERGIVRDLIARSGAVVAAEVTERSAFAEAVLSARPQLVVVGDGIAFTGAAEELVRAASDLRVLALRDSGRAGVLYELRAEAHDVVELGVEAIAAAVERCR